MSVVQSPSKSVYFVSLGCPKNLVDSQVMLGKLKDESYRISQSPEDAEVIIVNTCSFIQAAKEESVETILEMAAYKDKGTCESLVVSGCLAQRYSAQLEKDMPEVDLFIGTGEYHRITDLLTLKREGEARGEQLLQRSYVNQPAFIHSESDARLLTGKPFTGYLKISEGCNRRCSFCIIPKLRGNVRSRTVESLVAEARSMVAKGVREINLVAQDLTEYGMEWKYRESLETLLPELCKIDGLEWLRLHYVYPDQFSNRLIDIVATEPKIVKYLDMPIQHTNDRVLKAMNRRLTKDKLFLLVEKLRQRIPGLVFRTSIIVGFPSETESEFQELCRDLQALSLDHVGVFRYSREEGTPAAQLEDQIHPATRRRRSRELIALLQENAWKKKQKMLGQLVPVLVEGVSDETELLLQGRMSTQAEEIDGHILINDVSGLRISAGDLVECEIQDVHPTDYVASARRVLRSYSAAASSAAVQIHAF